MVKSPSQNFTIVIPLLKSQIKFMKLKRIASIISNKAAKIYRISPKNKNPHQHYSPTPYLAHPFLQSVYNITQPLFPFQFQRQHVYFEDGGHVSLDWLHPKTQHSHSPILFVMHGLTGGSQMNYIKQLVKPASQQGYRCVCLNSRGINSEMTSPIPFTGMSFNELNSSLQRIARDYPHADIYMVGTSFGGNYLLRYLLRQQPNFNIKGLVTLAPPLNVTKVVEDMGSVYQKFFVKRYIEQTVTRHKEMQFWQKVGLVDMKEVKQSQTLEQFHGSLTAKILGFGSAKQIFDYFTISEEQLSKIKVKTFIILSKDDPIVSYSSMPVEQMRKNNNITLLVTQKGGHLCWFQGIKPKRWYPKPVLHYLRSIRNQGVISSTNS